MVRHRSLDGACGARPRAARAASGQAKPPSHHVERHPSLCHPCDCPLLLHLIPRLMSVTQTSWLDFLSQSISLPSSCLLALQNETPSLEIRSGVGESRPQGTLAESAIWVPGQGVGALGREQWALPPASSGNGPGCPVGLSPEPQRGSSDTCGMPSGPRPKHRACLELCPFAERLLPA